MSTDLQFLRDMACDLAVQAGDVLLAERVKARTQVTTKENANDYVSAADLASERLIVEALSSARPDDGILGEEGGTRSGSNDYVWVIDPLDGTRNYVDGCGPFAVSIGLERQGDPILGVIRDPTADRTLSAIRGQGAYCNAERIAASQRDRLNESVVGLSLLPNAEGGDLVLKALQSLLPAVGDFRRLGSAVTQLALVACGSLDATVSMAVRRWDVSAGIVIAQEAGAAVVGVDGGPPSERLTIAAAPGIIDELREYLSVLN